MPIRRRSRWDPQPTEPCEVLLASDGREPFSESAVARAAALSGGGAVGVVTVAKVYGTSFGLPHPGLLPTKAELAERRGWVEEAVARLRRDRIEADGQVAVTRRTTKKLAQIAVLRGARGVVIDETSSRGLRRRIEGDVGSELRRKLRRHGIDVEIVPHRLRG